MQSKSNPIVSIVIPYYNGKRYINETVCRLLSIPFSKEIIIVDDGSDFENSEYLDALFSDNKEVVLVHKENGGIVTARNIGIDNASGKYIMFVDQDDIPVPTTINAAIKLIEEAMSPLLVWSTDQVDESGKISPFTRVKKSITLGRSEIVSDIVKTLLYFKMGNFTSSMGQIWACVYNREFIASQDIRFKKFIDFEDDNIFIFDCLSKAESITLFNEVGYIYRVRSSSYSRGFRYYEDYYSKLNNFYEYYRDKYSSICDEGQDTERYYKYSIQDMTIKLLINCSIKPNRSDWNQIKLLIKSNRHVYGGEMLVPNSKFNRFAYWCIKQRMPLIVILANKLRMK